MVNREFQLIAFTADDTGMENPATVPNIRIGGTLSADQKQLAIHYELAGSLAQIILPDAGKQACRRDHLWQTTCFELFIRDCAKEEYWEYNLAPSHDWNVYHFQKYRQTLGEEAEISHLTISTRIENQNTAMVTASLPLPTALIGCDLAIGISSVIEDTRGQLHYYALSHQRAAPDFHDPAGFGLILPISSDRQPAQDALSS